MTSGTDLNEQVLAMGSIVGTTGAKAASAGQFASGRTSAGLYTITLQAGGADSTQCVCLATLRGASGVVRVTQTSDLVKTVETFAVDGTTATDKDFDFRISYLAPGQ